MQKDAFAASKASTEEVIIEYLYYLYSLLQTLVRDSVVGAKYRDEIMPAAAYLKALPPTLLVENQGAVPKGTAVPWYWNTTGFKDSELVMVNI